MSLAAELEATLKEFLASGLVVLHEHGGRTSFASGLCWEVRGDAEKPLWRRRCLSTLRRMEILVA